MWAPDRAASPAPSSFLFFSPRLGHAIRLQLALDVAPFAVRHLEGTVEAAQLLGAVGAEREGGCGRGQGGASSAAASGPTDSNSLRCIAAGRAGAAAAAPAAGTGACARDRGLRAAPTPLLAPVPPPTNLTGSARTRSGARRAAPAPPGRPPTRAGSGGRRGGQRRRRVWAADQPPSRERGGGGGGRPPRARVCVPHGSPPLAGRLAPAPPHVQQSVARIRRGGGRPGPGCVQRGLAGRHRFLDRRPSPRAWRPSPTPPPIPRQFRGIGRRRRGGCPGGRPGGRRAGQRAA